MSSNLDNLFARDGFWWWIGVVEDRMDPLKLGRVRVRIRGYHSDVKTILPTADLPWAMPMQPVVSAAISGKGETPLGPLEGTWVVGFFADGSECQQPIIMGTIGGIPGTSNACVAQAKADIQNTNTLKDAFGNVVKDQNGLPVVVQPESVAKEQTSSMAITSTLPPLSQLDVQSYMDAIALKESSSQGTSQNYSVVNDLGYVGKYQMGAQALQTIGYLKTPIPRRSLTNAEMSDPKNWTGKDNVYTLDEFKQNKNNVQEKAMFEFTKSNYNLLVDNGVLDMSATPRDQVAGYLAVAHLLGWTGAKNLQRGVNGADANGVRGTQYYNIGVLSQGGISTTPVADSAFSTVKSALNSISTALTSWAGALNNPKLGQPPAFSDPNSVYPTCDYTARPDTNKLATNTDNLNTTPVPEKDADRIDNIPTANGASSGSWEEPPSAYNAKYPYNHVKETESGHVIELDDTPNAERIHIWHRTGTYVEIDREGSVTFKVQGENTEIFKRNNRMYIMGNHDITVDGAKTLLVKNALDVEVLGKTTINIKNDADLNVSGTFNIKAQNINIEAQQDLNITTGNYFNNKVGGDLNYRVLGDEQHKISGDFDLDASTVNINSGTANPITPTLTGLGDGLFSNIYGSTTSAFEETGLYPLPVDIANPQNAVSKGLSSIFGTLSGDGSGGGILGLLSKLPSAAGENSLGMGSVLLGGGSGLTDTGSAFGNLFGTGGSLGNLLPSNLVQQGADLVKSFKLGNVGTVFDNALPKQLLNSVGVVNEFSSWTDFPASAQLSKYFNLGDLSSRVQEVGLQSFLSPQGGLSMDQIATNLKALAVNTLDPLKAKYPNLVISDAFKPVASQLIGSDPYGPLSKVFNEITNNLGDTALAAVQNQLNSATPFNLGQAANLQFKGAQASDYYSIAKWMKDNVPYDQIRLEYSTLGTGMPWITVVHKQDGNRAVDASDKIVTAVNGQVVANYLVDMTS